MHSINAIHDLSLSEEQKHFSIPPEQFGKYIRAHFEAITSELRSVGLNYQDLKNVLVPSREKKEIALLFNIQSITSGFYGKEVNTMLLPLLGRKSSHSVLTGDVLQPPEITRTEAIDAGLSPSTKVDWGSQFTYSIYINNLSKNQVKVLHSSFIENESYLGFVDTTYSSKFRDSLSRMISTTYIKSKEVVLLSHDEEVLVSDQNTICYPFNENKLNVVSVHSQLFGALLTYKIQANNGHRGRIDRIVSLNAISDDPMDLEDFTVDISVDKFNYLHTNKRGSLVIAGIENLTLEQLAALIKAQIQNGSLFNLKENIDESIQFSVIPEISKSDGRKFKILVGLKYIPTCQKLELVTLF